MGRKKITIKPIDCPRLRSVTFYKRRKGLLKKAMELAVLCQSHVFLAFVDNETGKLVTFNSHSVKALRNLFRKTPLHLRENFKAQDYDFLYGDSQACNKSGRLPQRDRNNIKIEDEDDQGFDQPCGSGEGAVPKQEEASRSIKRLSKMSAKSKLKALRSSEKKRLPNQSNDIKLCDSDSEEDKELGLFEQQNSEDDIFLEPDMFQQQPQKQQMQKQQLQQYQNEDNSENHQNMRYSHNQFNPSRVDGQFIHTGGLRLNLLNNMMNTVQEGQGKQFDHSRKVLSENIFADQTKSQQDNEQNSFKGTQKKMKQKLKIQNIDIGDDKKSQPYKLIKKQSFQFMGNNFAPMQKSLNKPQTVDDQNSSTNTATIQLSNSFQMPQNSNTTGINPSLNQVQQLQQSLLNNQVAYQQLKSLNSVHRKLLKFQPSKPLPLADMSPYPLLLTPSPFPSSLFLPNLGAALTPNNPLCMNNPNHFGFDLFNHPLLSNASPLLQSCQNLFNQQEMTPGVGNTPLQNPFSRNGFAGLNNTFNNNQQNILSSSSSSINQPPLNEKMQGSDGKQQPQMDKSSSSEQGANYFNPGSNNLRSQSQGLNLQSLNQPNEASDNQPQEQQPIQQQQPRNQKSQQQLEQKISSNYESENPKFQ